MEALQVVDPNSARPANMARPPCERAAYDGALPRADGQREPKHSEMWRYIAGGLVVIFIITAVGMSFYFDSERSEKEAIVRGFDSQRKKLQNEFESCKANVSETHGEVHRLNLSRVADSMTIDCLENKVKGCETRLSEKSDKYDRLQDEYRKELVEKNQLDQQNQGKTQTIEAQTKEIKGLKAKLSEAENERNRAKDVYGKEKQENEKCKSKLSSESKMVQDQKQTIHDLSVKLQTAEMRFHEQKKEEYGFGGSIAIGVIVVVGIIAFIALYGNSK